MKPLQASLLAGAAAMMIAGTAFAQGPNTHVLTIQLPGGGVGRIQYTGNTPPQVFVDANPARTDSLWFVPGFGPDSPFAALDRMSQELDQRAARMLEQAEVITRLPIRTNLSRPTPAAFRQADRVTALSRPLLQMAFAAAALR